MPLAVALLNVSNPEMGPMDMLSRLSHDSDEAVAQNAILALGVPRVPTNILLCGQGIRLDYIQTNHPTDLFRRR